MFILQRICVRNFKLKYDLVKILERRWSETNIYKKACED